MVRLFVGGLARDITSEQLASRFETFGSVTKCTVIGPKSTDPFKGADVTCRGFGYLELDPANDSALRKCLTVYNGSRWRGGVLRVQPAKQHFLDKLHLEREEEKHSEEERRQKEQENKQTQESSAVAQSKTPLIFTRPDGEEFEVRPNKRKISFAEHEGKQPSEAAWESVPAPASLLRRQVFVKAMEASFDASAARQAWKEEQQADAKSPASSEELGAVDFADNNSEVDQQVLDLSRFSDDEE